MNETLLDYAINPTPNPIQASPSTGDPSQASLVLVVSNKSGDIITCSNIALSFRTGTNAEDFCSDPTGISSSPQTGWNVRQQASLFVFTPDTKEKGQVGGDGLVFTLSGIKVNQQPGTFVITIAEEASDPHAPDQIRSLNKQLTKFPALFAVGDLNANPPIVESGGSTTLSWSGSGSSANYTALYEIQYVDADGDKVTIDHPKGEENQPLPPIGGYTVDELKADPTTFYLLVTVQIQGSNNPLVVTRETTVTVIPPHPAVNTYTGELQSDGSLLLKWTTLGDTAILPNLTSEIFLSKGQYKVANPPVPWVYNDRYALTAMNYRGEKSHPCVFTTQKFEVVGPAIGVGRYPSGIAVSPDSGYVFVTNLVDNNVSVIEVNLNNNPPFRVLPAPVSTGNRPWGIAVSPDGNYVFVQNQNHSVTVFSGKPPFQPFTLPCDCSKQGRYLAVSRDSRYVFVPNDTALSVIDTTNAFKVIQGPTFGVWTLGIAASPDGHYLFVSDARNGHNGSLWVLQLQGGANPPYRALSSLGMGDGAWSVAVSPDGHYVFVANFNGDSISVIEVSSGPSFRVLSPVGAGRNPGNLTVSADSRFLFMTRDLYPWVWVWVIDKNSDPPVKPLQTLLAGNSTAGIAASPDGRFIFVTDVGDNTISVIAPVWVSM